MFICTAYSKAKIPPIIFLYKYTTQIAYSDNRGYHISWSIEDIGLIFEYDIDGHMDRHP